MTFRPPAGERGDEASILIGHVQQRVYARVARRKHIFVRHTQECFRQAPDGLLKFLARPLVGFGHRDKSRPADLMRIDFIVELFPRIGAERVKMVLTTCRGEEGMATNV